MIVRPDSFLLTFFPAFYQRAEDYTRQGGHDGLSELSLPINSVGGSFETATFVASTSICQDSRKPVSLVEYVDIT
jgi:hypothetical protein